MPIRHSSLDRATARAARQLATAIDELIVARRSAGLSQSAIADVLGVSRSTVAAWEQRRVEPSFSQLSRWAAVVGLDASLRTFAAGDPLRDSGQLRLLHRFRRLIGPPWEWRTEVPVTGDPRDRRAFDGVIRGDAGSAAVEAVVRLVDVQEQVRRIIAKQSASGIACVILVLADTPANRRAVTMGDPTLGPAFPFRPRPALALLRAGVVPTENSVVFA